MNTATNPMQITMRLLSAGVWSFDVIQRGEIVRSFPTADEAVAYIEMRS